MITCEEYVLNELSSYKSMVDVLEEQLAAKTKQIERMLANATVIKFLLDQIRDRMIMEHDPKMCANLIKIKPVNSIYEEDLYRMMAIIMEGKYNDLFQEE